MSARHRAAAGLAALLLLATATLGSGSEDAYSPLLDLAAPSRDTRRAAAHTLLAGGDRSLVAGLVEVLFFIPPPRRDEALEVLAGLAGARPGRSYHAWLDWLEAHPGPPPHPGYRRFKAHLLAKIDPRYLRLLDPSGALRIRPQEIVWGGVRVEGIPALDDPPHVAAAAAAYLRDDDRVFGVAAGGETRAYPLRILAWHEMANDRVGGEPVSLSFCTLCGSGVLYSGRLASGRELTLGTSGLLYRSNKLMVDRQTGSLWSNLTGEAVAGPLAAGPQPGRLEVLPVVVTSWGEWRRRHPSTTVLPLAGPIAEAGRRLGFDYRPGAAEERRTGVSFPAWPRSDALEDHEEIYAVRLGSAAKAYPLRRVTASGTLDDRVGGRPVVLVADPASGAVRAYLRGVHRFERGAGPDELRDELGRSWRLTEEALIGPERGPGAPSGGERLERLPGHRAFWFGWYAAHPDAELFTGSDPAEAGGKGGI